jgi:GH15 family glucan-1,4-alpha-glucosidase
MHTAALVGVNGSIDWLFAAILDDAKGGQFRIAPAAAGATCRQLYWPDTNVLITRFLLDAGVVEVTDYMPVGVPPGDPGFRQVVRRVEAVHGTVPLRVECAPAFNYGRDSHTIQLSEGRAVFASSRLALELTGTPPVALEVGQDRGSVHAVVTLKAGGRGTFVLRVLDGDNAGAHVGSPEVEQDLFERTIGFWHRWIGRCTYAGRWRERVHRSALTLKLLTFEPTGALIASPTCSLPEAIPGTRNWDYRYTWLRDAAFSLYGLLRIGFTEEAGAFMGWLEQRCHERQPDGGLQVAYGLRGEHDLTESTVDHLEGYRGCRPVRVGNAAFKQLQLDVYGELMDSVYLYNKHGAPVSYDFWVELRGLVNWVCDNWRRKDEGIWETRAGAQHFVYSKLMCWVAIDRGLRLADKRSFPADRGRWHQVRDEIYLDILKNGWSEKRNAFVQYYGSKNLDASNLIMPLVFFMAPNDPRMLATLDATSCPPEQGGLMTNSLVHRYNLDEYQDAQSGEEGTFNMCTFWLAEALTRAGRTDPRRLAQARLVFEKMLGFASHLGLYSEQTGKCGESLGNFPQAFTHLSLISAAFNLDRTLSGARS